MKISKKILILLFGIGIAILIYGISKLNQRQSISKINKEWRANFPHNIEYVKEMPNVDSLYIFIMAGQSNMAGRGFVEPQDTIPNKRILTIDKSMNWVYAKEPFHFYEPSMTGLDCGMSFAKKLLDSIPQNISIAIIPCAVGGSSIQQWLNDETFRGTTLLTNFKNKVDFAQKHGAIKGILWHQGENDATLERIPSYSQKLDSLINAFRKIVANNSLPVLIGEIRSYSESKETQTIWDSINSIIHITAKNKNGIFVIKTEDLQHKGDKLHFNSESQRKLGARFAQKYLESIVPKQNIFSKK